MSPGVIVVILAVVLVGLALLREFKIIFKKDNDSKISKK